jgi:23S rRNA pseudouridine2605 synthase
MELPAVNYLRTLVDMPEETVTKVAVEKDRRRTKANQIRRAVKRHSNVSGSPRRGGASSSRAGTSKKRGA